VRSNTETTVRDEPTFIEAARRTQIVRCAIDAIAELGFERASLAEIAKRARISKSVISYYFAGKDELIEQVVADVYALGGSEMLALIEKETTAAGMLRAYIAGNIAFMGAHRKDVQAIVEITSSFRTPDGKPRLDVTDIDHVYTDLEKLLLWGQETGEFRTFSASVMTHAIRGAIDALPTRLAVQPDLDLASFTSELTDLFDNATRKQPRKVGTK
jgi:AcrR family transcriptional regulator